MYNSTSHFLFATIPAWGHLHPLLTLALNLLSRFPNLYISLFIHTSSTVNVQKEIARFGTTEDVIVRLHVEPLGEEDEKNPYLGAIAMSEVLPDILKRCLLLKKDGEKFMKRPSLFVPDKFNVGVVRQLRKVEAEIGSTPELPALVFVPNIMGSHSYMYGKPENGGYIANFSLKADKLMLDHPDKFGPADREGAIVQAAFEPTGQLIKLPESPEFYNYEYLSQVITLDGLGKALTIVETSLKDFELSQGALIPSLPDFYSSSMAAKVRDFTGFDAYEIGPQFSPRFWAGDFGSDTKADDPTVLFLNKALAKHGKNSVVYISFGSMWFPTARLEFLEAVIQAFLSASPPMPVLFAAAGAPSETLLRLTDQMSDDFFVSSWVPQMSVLTHQATGWFLSHGGSNSLSEAMLTATPLIFWPIAADQPLIASKLSLDLKVSYELMQVRCSPFVVGKQTARGVVPLGTREAVTEEIKDLIANKLRGAEGEQTRENMTRLSETLRQSTFDEEGRAYAGLGKLAKFL